jgi:hypothetical protein
MADNSSRLMLSRWWENDTPDDDVVSGALAVAAGRLSLAKTASVIPFKRHRLYPKQAAIVDDPARFTITEATTKAGKTMSHIEWLLEEALEIGYGNHWWVAPFNGQAAIAFRRTTERLRGYIDSSGRRIRVSDPIPFAKHETEKWIDVGGARLWFKSAEKPDTLYGEDVYRIVGDEITRWREASWHAVYSTLTATNGRAKLIGNVKGRQNFAYRLARKAQAGESEWGYHKLTASDAIEGGVIAAETVEAAARDLPPQVFRELYEAEPSDDQGNPFGIAAISALIKPLSKLPPAVWGWDLAKSHDWTVGIGLDANGDTCRFERFQKPWQETTRIIRELTGRTKALVDSTGVGDPILESLQSNGGRNFDGFKFSQSSKQQLMEGLALAIHKAEISYPDEVANELLSFEFEYTRTGVRYSAPEGLHDDCVCALALARQMKVLAGHVVRPRMTVVG